MLYYFYGPDSYRRNKGLNSSIAEYKKKRSMTDLAVFDLAEEPEGWIKARDFLNQPSMFVDSKVLVIKESGAVAEKEWVKILKSNLETPRVFIMISDAKNPLKAFEFLTESPVKKDFFGELEGQFLELFVKRETAVRGLHFEKEAWIFLLDYFAAAAERSWVIINELNKISLLGLSEPIKSDDLKSVIAYAPQDEVFETAKQIMWSRDWIQKAKLLECLLLQKKEPAHIFNSLAFLAKGKELVRMADYDIVIKSGNLDYEEALLDFVLP
ncbi:MAG: hypothetical protein AAB730_00660 [Patescibacteria group bacterium]